MSRSEGELERSSSASQSANKEGKIRSVGVMASISRGGKGKQNGRCKSFSWKNTFCFVCVRGLCLTQTALVGDHSVAEKNGNVER